MILHKVRLSEALNTQKDYFREIDIQLKNILSEGLGFIPIVRLFVIL